MTITTQHEDGRIEKLEAKRVEFYTLEVVAYDGEGKEVGRVDVAEIVTIEG